MKEKIMSFMIAHDYCVISSVSRENASQSALVAFSSNHKLELIIGTSNESRKYKNIKDNPLVSVVIANKTGEIQYEGRANEVEKKNLSVVHNQHFAKIPGSQKYRDDPNQVWIHIIPSWIRFVQHANTDIIEEITEFS